MMTTCTGAPAGAGFISSVTGYLDCQAQALGSGTYQVLSAPGSMLAVVLSGFLTMFIALIGYNLLLGRGPTVRSGTLAFVKIGAILALATSWPAYRTLVYDLVIDGPAQLVAEIGPSAGVVGSDGTLLQRLDGTDQALAQLAVLGAGNPPAAIANQLPPPLFVGFDAFALGGSRILYLLSAVAGLASVRVVAGLLLALGPFFIGFLMFDSTRALFEGWLRVLFGAALAAAGVSIALGLQLALVEPWLSSVVARRMAGEALPTVAVEAFVIMCLFAILVLAVLYGCMRVAGAFRLAPMMSLWPATEAAPARSPVTAARPNEAANAIEHERSRAAAVASTLVSLNRRENQMVLAAGSSSHATGGGHSGGASRGSAEARYSVPIGQSFRRRSTSRVSARAQRRDLGS